MYIYARMYVYMYIRNHRALCIAVTLYTCVPQMSDSTSAGTPVIKPWLQCTYRESAAIRPRPLLCLN